MIPPVADIRPWIVRILYLPVDSDVADSIGIVAVDRRSIDELRNNIVDKTGKTECERFPVLENVAPVTLVRQESCAAVVPQAY